MGNLRSVSKAVEALGFEARVQPDLSGATRLILPGVGAFGAAMQQLELLKGAISDFAASGLPLLGICLGQQLLFDSSEEHGTHRGLGLIRGQVRYLPRDVGLKVPHVGWAPLSISHWESPLLRGIDEGEQVYFVHSLYTECADNADILATASHGLDFPAAVQRGNVWGCQFHPEKSGSVGLKILHNFLTATST